MTKSNRDVPRFGTYRNGHNFKLVSNFNKVVDDLTASTIVDELLTNYFDDEDIKHITIFFEERFEK